MIVYATAGRSVPSLMYSGIIENEAASSKKDLIERFWSLSTRSNKGWEERESSFHELYLKAIEKPTMIRKQKEANWAFEQTIQNTFQISMLSKHVERRDNRNDCSDETEVFHLIEREVWIEFDHVIESTPEGSHFVLKEPTIPRKHTRDYSL